MLSRVQPAIILHPVMHREQFYGTSETFVRAIPARTVIGWSLETSGGWRQKRDDALYTLLVQRDYAGKAVNLHNATFLRALGVADYVAGLPRLPRFPAPLEPDRSRKHAYFVLFPAAGSSQRCWSADCFADFGRRLYAATGWCVVLAGARSDQPVCEDVRRLLCVDAENLAGQLMLPALTEVIRGARFLLANETGIAHIGGACLTPTVCVLGGGHYGEFLPYKLPDDTDASNPVCVTHPMPCFGCGWQCLYRDPAGVGPVPCIARISVDEVWAATCRQLHLTVGPSA